MVKTEVMEMIIFSGGYFTDRPFVRGTSNCAFKYVSKVRIEFPWAARHSKNSLIKRGKK